MTIHDDIAATSGLAKPVCMGAVHCPLVSSAMIAVSVWPCGNVQKLCLSRLEISMEQVRLDLSENNTDTETGRALGIR